MKLTLKPGESILLDVAGVEMRLELDTMDTRDPMLVLEYLHYKVLSMKTDSEDNTVSIFLHLDPDYTYISTEKETVG